jgi:hypothetical protein
MGVVWLETALVGQGSQWVFCTIICFNRRIGQMGLLCIGTSRIFIIRNKTHDLATHVAFRPSTIRCVHCPANRNTPIRQTNEEVKGLFSREKKLATL